MIDLKNQIANAAKWSTITEVLAKLIAPITTVVLARLLTPEAFGVVATVTMIISFTEIFTDAGFQKYLIQHNFINDKEKDEYTTIAFWTNFAISILLWIIIALSSNTIAKWVGNPGLGYVITISCISVPLAAFSSIQMALFKRDFDFKNLFYVRIIGILIPIIVTLPLAFFLRNFWALIIGTIAVNLSNAIILTLKSKWKPTRNYDFDKLKKMLSFSIWTMIESISIWITGYADIFIVGVALNEYYLGIYKTSITTVGQIMGLITAATTPVLFSSLSRLQQDHAGFKEMFFKFQKIVAILVFPIGFGIFIYSDLVTYLLLGEQWKQASGFIGIWALMSTITIVLSHYSSEVYRAKGRPKLSVLAQMLHIIVLVPTLIICVRYSFEVLYYARSLVRIQILIVNLILMFIFINLSPLQMIKNITPAFISACMMGCLGYFLKNVNHSLYWSFLTILISGIFYLIIIIRFQAERNIISKFAQHLIPKLKKCQRF